MIVFDKVQAFTMYCIPGSTTRACDDMSQNRRARLLNSVDNLILTYILVPEELDVVEQTCAVAATDLLPEDTRRVDDSAKQDWGRDVGCQRK